MTKALEIIRKLLVRTRKPFVRTETEAEFNARKKALVDQLRAMAAEEEKKR